MAILSGIERIDEALLNSAELDHAATEEAVARRQTARKTRKRTQTAPRSLPEGAFPRAPTHPRAYGSFARVLGHYVRDEKVLPLWRAASGSTFRNRHDD
jgi:hypothetical protein